ncbi:MAG TPA: hypothetical protein VF381_01210, partial [Thermoanaerobaculia bacterium]
VVLAALSIAPDLFRFVLHYQTMQPLMNVFPDRGWIGYTRFLESVRARTKRGDTIALVVPNTGWERGYGYAYYRASYFLAGREVLPVIDRKNVPQPQNAARAKYVATWNGRGDLQGR